MEAFELYKKVAYCPTTQPLTESNPYKQTGVWACGQCRVVHSSFGKANDCCSTTETCSTCGFNKPRNSYCTKCADATQKKLTESRLAEAEIVTAFTYLYHEGTEKFFADMDAVLDHLSYIDEEQFNKFDTTAWDCEARSLKDDSIDVVEMIKDRIRDEYHEDAEDELKAQDELQNFVNKWLEKQTIVSYFPDFTRVVDLKDIYNEAKEERKKNV